MNAGTSTGPASQTYDVVIAGGSSGGIGAAIGAARMGVRVALIEDTPVLGGMLANGISNIDCYSYESLSGVFEEFRRTVRDHYAPIMETDPFCKAFVERPSRHIDGRSVQANAPHMGGRWEPHVADRIWKAMAAAYSNLEIYYRRFVTDVVKQGERITGLVTQTDEGEHLVLYGTVIIDATHEADVAAWAGAPYRVGREPRSPLEPHAGQIYFYNSTGEFMPGSTGRQDMAVPSCGLRLCVQNYGPDAGEDHLLKSPPEGYDAAKFKLAQNYRGAPSMPNGKGEMNVNPVGSELQEINWAWPEASREQRRQLYEVYKRHALSFLYYLQHERGLTHIGLPRDEFVDNDYVPYRVFIREARRIEGEAMMTEADVNSFMLGRGLAPPPQPTSIAVGHYPIDAKPAHAKTDPRTPDKGEGDYFLVSVAAAFQVPYGAIVPKQVDGLLVPVGLSATHVAFSAVRMDPTWTVLGQAAGIAAAMSVRQGVAVRELAVDALQRELVRQRVKLAFFWDVDTERVDFEAIQILAVRGVVQADAQRCFHPDDPLTRAEAAAMICRAFDLWPSISATHFADVSWSHPAFREIETLFDHGLLSPLGVKPRWPEVGGYEPDKHAGFAQQHERFDPFEPERTVAVAEWRAMIDAAASRCSAAASQAAAPSIDADDASTITRGDASRMLAAHLAPESATDHLVPADVSSASA